MLDPLEGIAPDGTIVTGADRRRVPPAFEAALTTVLGSLDVPLYLYGSVATGQARPGHSDLDLLTVGGIPEPGVAQELSARLAGLVRGVEISTLSGTATGDEAYGDRLFLRHYCVPLTAPAVEGPAFPADARAARGLGGDIARHAEAWWTAPPSRRRIARKTLLALAGLVSVHDGIWTTDRRTAARRWCRVRPELAPGLRLLLAASDRDDDPSPGTLLDDVVAPIVEDFRTVVGLWS